MRLARLVSAGLLLAAFSWPAAAKKLDKLICDDLKVELGLLQQKGIAIDMAKGPDWAKANASRERLKEIERLIFVEEQLAFRCPQPKKPLAPGEDEDGNVTAAPAKKGAGQAQAKAPAAKAQPKAAAGGETGSAPAAPPKKQAKPAAEQPAKEAAAAPAPATPKPAPKPKPKVDDAYSPAASGEIKPSTFPKN